MSRLKKINLDARYQPLKAASYISGFSRGYILNGCKAGDIPHVRVGVDYRVDMESWNAMLDRKANQ